MTTTTKTFQQLIGQTEKTLNAILARHLGDSVSEPQWIALVLLSGRGAADRQEFTGQVAHALRVDEQTASNHVSRLAARGLIGDAPGRDSAVALTEAGRQFVGQTQEQLGTLTGRLWGDLPAADMAVAQRVLGIVLERAEAELSAAS